eukprot:5734352-Pleurochrysis_carterae.AAC.1
MARENVAKLFGPVALIIYGWILCAVVSTPPRARLVLNTPALKLHVTIQIPTSCRFRTFFLKSTRLRWKGRHFGFACLQQLKDNMCSYFGSCKRNLGELLLLLGGYNVP